MSTRTTGEWTATAVRDSFRTFFEERGHTFARSSPVFPQDDPTLLFTNAGMNQFKDVFLGTGSRPYTRAVNSQKCIRASGKHNDLEDVGLDTYHHTFFEMLGNWSFGDYFKREAIAWAWELLTEVWQLPKERLWVTVFGGDEADGLDADTEAEELWREVTDIAPERVLRFDRTDNFWEMGETGPCGPCSEIHIDRGAAAADPRDGADPTLGVNAGNERFIELWNLVFMQFNRLDDGSLVELPAKHVDTGMGFERVLSILEGKASNYDTDLFTPLFERIGTVTGRRYGTDDARDVAFRVIADHLRAVSAALADGALPSNEGRGYVLRRLVRRAARFGRQALEMDRPFLYDVAPAVGEILGGAFPEIVERMEHIQLVVRSEEESFGKTLDRGLVLFGQLAKKLEASGTTELPGAESFDLYATYGFPKDLVEQMARERGWTLDQAGWDTAEEEHRSASRSEGRFKQLLSAEQLDGLEATRSTYHAEGPEAHELETRVTRFVPGAADGTGARLVLEASPFYPEGGGQIGDAGQIVDADGRVVMEVEDTKKVGTIVVHLGKQHVGHALAEGDTVRARVDTERRARTKANHTATHLLHKALRDVLGDHVTQQGSYVGPDRLRFDLSHPKGLTPEEIDRIERLVNAEIARNATLRTTVEDLEEAKARGVVALFGEKYDTRVRVVDVPGFSTELCGGTHVRSAGDIGPFVIVLERALQAGVRRIEALTREAAVEHLQHQRSLLAGAARELNVAVDEIPARIAGLKDEVKKAKKKKAQSKQADTGAALGQVEAACETWDGVTVAVVDLPELDAGGLRELSGRVEKLAPDLLGVLFGRDGDRVPFLVICEGRALEAGLAAGALAKSLAPILGGGGGGKPNRAQGQGLKASAVPDALEEARRRAREALGG